MSSRRSKRKPLQKVCDDQNGTEVKKRKRKAKGPNDEQLQGRVANGIQRSSRLKSAKAVNYREEENSSGNDDPVERDDPEYENSADEDKDFDLSLKRSAKKASVRRVKAKIKEDIKEEDKESSDSENDLIKTNVSFEVSKLKTEINLSSDEESDIADNSGRGEKEGCEVAFDASGNESHLLTSDCKQDVDVKVNINDEKTPSNILKRKTSLFEESDGEDEDFVKDEEKESHKTGAKREKRAVVKIKRLKVTKGPKGPQEEESVVPEKREDEIAEPRKRPKRKCRKSPVKTIQNKNKQKRQPEGIKKEVEKNVIVEKKGKKQMNKTKLKKTECKPEKSSNSQENMEDTSPTINTEMIDTGAKDGGNLSESSDEEWEDVEDIQPGGSPKKKKQTESAISSVVEIDIEMPGAAKKKRRAYDWADYYRRQLNRFNKDRQIELHKIHLLCLLANGFHRNKVCNEPLLQATALSLIPPDVLKYKPKSLSTDFVYKLLFWFMKHFPVTAALPCSSPQNYPVFQLMQAMQNQKFSSVEEVVIVFVLCIRALGGDARLVFSLQPMTWKADLVEKNSKGKNSKSSSPKSPLTPPAKAAKSKTVKKEQTSSETPKASSSKAAKTNKKNRARQKAKDVKKEVSDIAKEDEEKSSKKKEAKGGRKRVSTSVTRKAGQIRKLTKKSQSIKYDSQDNDGDDDDDFEEVKQTPQRSLKAKGQRSSSKKGMSVKSQDNDDDDDDDFEEVKQTPQSRLKAKGQRSFSTKGKSVKERNQSKNNRRKVNLEEDSDQDSGDEMTTPKRNLRRRKVKKATVSKSSKRSDDEGDKEEDKLSSEASNYSEEEWIHQKKSATKTVKQGNKISPNASKDLNDSDSDFDIETLSMKKRQNSASKLQKNYKILSSDSDNMEEIAKKRTQEKGIDVWCEVFVPAENMWVSVDCSNGFVNKPHHLEALATKPLLYVVGFDKDNSAKDITQRYAKRWMAHNIKLRIEKFDENWWSETLGRYKSKDKKRNRVEDEQMEAHNLDKPLPKSIVEYKNHPMYALERHLLKFEGIYPPTAAVLGYCRREPVYSRDCIHTLKSKHTWMKEARVVKDGEQPYKFVKKLVNPFKRHLLTPEEQNQMLDIYGEWQTEDYIPPPAKDGIVPRNEYGNVELFKPCMLPKGTVHLQIPGLNRVANKLDIDCAPAMMGWEFHKRFACPILDGFVVCEEVADVLVAAWEEEKVEQEKKRKLKREQRAMKNWKHIIKSIMIRERLKEKYQLEEETEPEETKEKGKGKGKGKKVQKTKAYWPQNKMTTFQGDASNLLPFEKKSAKS